MIIEQTKTLSFVVKNQLQKRQKLMLVMYDLPQSKLVRKEVLYHGMEAPHQILKGMIKERAICFKGLEKGVSSREDDIPVM